MKLQNFFLFFVLLICVIIPKNTYAQNPIDTLIKLEQVQISAKKLNSPFARIVIDTISLKNQSINKLSELLSEHTTIFIKSYGQNNLATASFRGTNASHNQVVWNGVNLNSPMLGQVDLSTIPVFFIDNASVLSGSQSVFKNAGSFGATVELSSNIDNNGNSILSFSQILSSINSRNTFLKTKIRIKKLYLQTRLFYEKAENDYQYADNTKPMPYPIMKRENSDYENKGLLQEMSLSPNKKSVLNAALWYQSNYRNIPQPLSVVLKGQENQTEEVLRTIISYKYFKKHTSFEVKTADNYSDFYYYRSLDTTKSRNFSNTFSNSLEINHRLKNFRIVYALQNNYIYINSKNYSNSKFRNIFSMNLGIERIIAKRIETNLVFRKDWLLHFHVPLIPTLTIQYKPMQKYEFYIDFAVTKNYHIPTMNELYWFPNGNPNLEPEEGMLYDFGFSFSKKYQEFSFYLSNNAFYSLVNNWIIWYPSEINSNFWKPYNLRTIENMGLESLLRLNYAYNKFKVYNNFVYSYTIARNTKNISLTDDARNKQLIYVPYHNANNTIGMVFNNLSVNFTTKYVGKRFTTLDNSRYMPDFVYSDCGVSYKIALKKHNVRLLYTINNVFNTDYQVISLQPMPRRYYQFGFTFNLNRNEENN